MTTVTDPSLNEAQTPHEHSSPFRANLLATDDNFFVFKHPSPHSRRTDSKRRTSQVITRKQSPLRRNLCPTRDSVEAPRLKRRRPTETQKGTLNYFSKIDEA